MAGSETTLGKTLGHRARQPLCHSVIQQHLSTTIYQHHTPIISASNHVYYLSKYISKIVRLLSHGLSNLYHHMSIIYFIPYTSAIYPAYITWNQQSSSPHVNISLIHHFSTITGPKALTTSLSAMPFDSSQPNAIIIYSRPHGLINGSRLTLPKLPWEPTGCASPGVAGGTQRPRPCPRLCHFMLSYCVLCFAIFGYLISPDQDL